MAGVCEPFVGVFDGSGGISLPAGDLGGTPSDPVVIGLGGQWTIVTTFAQFEAVSVEAPAGVWTYNVPIILVGNIIVPAGDRIVSGETGFLKGFQFNQGQLIGDVNGVLLSGPLIVNEVNVINTNLGASAWAVEIISLLGRTCVFNSSVVIAIRGIRVTNLLAAAAIALSASFASNSLIGIRFSNIIGQFASTRFVSLAAPGAIGLDIDSTAVVSVALLTQGLAVTLLDPPEFAVAISDSMVLAPGAILHITGSSVTGPQDQFLRQDPGDMLASDIRLVAVGNPSLANWSAVADAARRDVVFPLSVVLPATPSAPVPVPYSTGAGLEVEPNVLIRFTVFKDPGDVNRWWARYSGPTPSRGSVPSWGASFAKVGGADRDFTACVEVNPALRVASVQQDDGGVFTDFTVEAQDEAVDDVPLTPSPFAVGDAIYFGADAPFETLEISISQAGVGTFTIVWEFWDGGAWVAVVGLSDGTAGFTAAPGLVDVDHTPQPGWAAVTVNSANAFYLRSRLSVATSLTTQPRASKISTYTGFTVIETTVLALQSTAARQSTSKSGTYTINTGDRFRPAMQNLATAQTIFVHEIDLSVTVTA